MATPIPPNHAAFTLEEILQVTRGKLLTCDTVLSSSAGVSTDTRGDLEGKVFVALRGDRFDAHAYLRQASDAGSLIVIAEFGKEAEEFRHYASRQQQLAPSTTTASLVCVEDTLVALGQLAQYHRSRWPGKLVAVAGSVGKTTTRSVISAFLEHKYPLEVHSTPGNLNNRIGVPMVLLGLSSEHRFAVVELGTNCPGEIAALTRMSRPDVALLTLIDLEHTEGLGCLEGVEAEERDVFSCLAANGTAIGFGDDERVLRSLQGSASSRKWTYGFAEDRDLVIRSSQWNSPQQTSVTLTGNARPALQISSPLVGRAGALAVAAGVLCVEALIGERLSGPECDEALVGVGEPGRSTIRSLPGDRWIVDDTYNASPVSVENSIQTGKELSAKCGGQLWLVLGEMLELGTLSAQSHKEMGKQASSCGAAGAFFVQGDAQISAQIAKERVGIVRFFADSNEVAAQLGPLVGPSDVVVVKASRGVKAERVVEGLAAFFHPERPSGNPVKAGDNGSTQFSHSLPLSLKGPGIPKS